MDAIVTRGFTIDQWCEEFARVNAASYQDIDSVSVWMGFVENATTSVAEFVRREEYSLLIDSIGEAFGGLCCFSAWYKHSSHRGPFRFTKSLADMIWNKYPGVCYRCTHKFTASEISGSEYLACVCLSTPKVPSSDYKLRTKRLEQSRKAKKKPQTLDDWTEMTRAIYGPNHREYSLASICLHFLEEVGEVAKELRKLHELEPLTHAIDRGVHISELQDEIADVFSWTMGLLNKVDQVFDGSRRYYDVRSHASLPHLRASDVAVDALKRWKTKKVL